MACPGAVSWLVDVIHAYGDVVTPAEEISRERLWRGSAPPPRDVPKPMPP